MRRRRSVPIITSSALASLVLAAFGPAAAGDGALDCVVQPRSTIKLGSPEEGILEELLVTRGERVEKGQLLARLEMELERYSAELARLRAATDVEIRSGNTQLDFRRKEFKRVIELERKNVVAEKDYDQADVEQRLAELELEAAKTSQRLARVEYKRAKAHLERRSIRSPLDGIVVDVTLSPGEYVHEQAPLMTIAEIDPLYVEVFAPVARYGSISEGMTAAVEPEEPIGGSYSARVVVVDRVFDPASRTFGVRLELPNPDYALPAGMRCTVRFLDTSETKVDAELDLNRSD